MEVTYGKMNFEEDQVNFVERPKENWKDWISNRKKKIILFSALVILIALACTISLSLAVLKAEYTDEIKNLNNLSRIKKENLLKYLHQISGTKAFISGVRCEKPTYDTIENSSKITKAFPGVVATSLLGHSASSTQWKTFIEDVIFIWNNHHLVNIWWWENSPFCSMDIFTVKSGNTAEREKKWKDLMLEGSFLNTKWKEQLDLVTPHLLKLQTAGVVPILDILPHINYYDLIWNGRPGVNGSVKFYKMTQDYLKHKHNYISVIWVWSVDQKVMSNIGEYWPGGNYVDVVSLQMGGSRQLSTNEYRKLVNFVGDKPMSMENMHYVPPTQLFAAQPRWTWFTAPYLYLDNKWFNSVGKVHATFNSMSVINAENITFFDNTN